MSLFTDRIKLKKFGSLLVLTLAAILAGQCSLSAQSSVGIDYLYFTKDEIANVKKLADQNSESVAPQLAALKKYNDKMIDKGPWSVMDAPSPAASGDPHDYFSEGPYWWPDPQNPNGPYIRKDGEVNPERFEKHRRAMEFMTNSVLGLSSTGYFLNCDKCSERAITLMNVWFVDPATKMNPHMDYAQAIRGITNGRGIGIIDSRSLVDVLIGINFLKASGKWDSNSDVAKGVNSWFKSYLNWLTTSKNGLDEKTHGNNHSTWWTVQVSAIAAYLNDTKTFDMVINYTKELIESEIEADGSCPLEEERTKSLGYSSMNLDAFSMTCRLAQLKGIDLWNVKNSKGASVAKSMEYLFPYIKDPSTWKKEQIEKYGNSEKRFLAFGGMALDKPEYLALYKEESSPASSTNDPFVLLLNLVFHASNR